MSGHARADDRGAGRRMRVRGPEIRRPVRLLQLCREALELAAADVLEVAARRRRCRLLVEEDRQIVPARDLGADLARQRDAFGHRHPLDRHERHDVDGAEPGMLARVVAQVDRAERLAEERQRRRLDRGAIARERVDRPVVRGVRLDVEKMRAGPADRRGARLEHVGTPAFADVRDALDNRHGQGSTTVEKGQRAEGKAIVDAWPRR